MTTSYEISKRLAEIGFKAETDFCWYKSNNVDGSLDINLLYIGDDCDMDAKPMQPNLEIPSQQERATLCYDLETILEALPESLTNGNEILNLRKDQIGYFWHEQGEEFCMTGVDKQDNESLADTAARLLIWLESKNLISFKNA